MGFKSVMAGVALLGASFAGSAHATTVDSINFGTLSNWGNIVISDFTVQGIMGSTGYISQNTPNAISSTAGTYGTSGAGTFTSSFTIPTTFSSGALPQLNLTLTTNNPITVLPANFYVKDVTTNTTYGSSVTGTATSGGSTGNVLSLAALLTRGDTYTIYLTVPSTGGGLQAYQIVGSVPVPGALLMFGAGLVGLFGVRYARNRAGLGMSRASV